MKSVININDKTPYRLFFGQYGVFFASIIAGAIGAGIAGFLIGLPCLRLKGDYLAIVTLAFGEIIKNYKKNKVANKLALQKELGLNEDPDAMLIGIVSRLTDQKGLDLIEYVMDELCKEDIQICVLGTGDPKYENMFSHYAELYPDKVAANIFYSDELSHKIYAGCDAFLMPSLFEPCGLSQLMSLRYGTLPIVRETGGLKDTVEAYNEYEGTGTGFSFKNYNAHEMLNIIKYAEKVFNDSREEWDNIVERAMKTDYSWSNSARQYEALYDSLLK